MTVVKAGRELDVLVAEKVMGWNKQLVGPFQYCWFDGTTPKEQFDFWAPSTSIHYAWMVVERLNERTPSVTYSHDGGAWACLMDEVGSTADTAPLAICLAALKACGDLTKEG